MAKDHMHTGELRQREERFRKLSESTLDAIVITRKGKIIDVNEQFLRQFGYELPEVIGLSAWEIAFPEYRDFISKQSLTEAPTTYEAMYRRKDRSAFWAQVSSKSLTYKEKIVRASVIRDITERKQFEQELQLSLELRARQVQTSTEIAQEIATVPALEDLFRRIINLIQNNFGYYHVHIYVLINELLVLQEGTGETGQKMWEAEHTIPLTAECSLVAQAARNREPVLVGNVDLVSNWLSHPLLPETKSELAVPITLGKMIYGVLDVQSNQIDGLNEEDQLLLVGLCGQIALALDHRQREKERQNAQRALQESERKYRQLVERANGIILEWNTQGRITFLNKFGQEFFGFSEDEIVGQSVVGTIIPDTDASGRNLAAMIADLGRRPDRYDTNENENIRKNGERVWISWSNKAILDSEGKTVGILSIGNDVTARRLAEQRLRRQNAYLAVLHDIALGLITRLDVDELLETITGRAMQLFEAAQATIYLREPDAPEMELKLILGLTKQEGNKTNISLGDGLSGKIWETGKPLVVDDYNSWAGCLPYVTDDVIRAIMGVPLITSIINGGTTISSQVIGVLSVAYGIDSKRTFSKAEVELLNRLGELASIALDNARLYATAQEARLAAENANKSKSVFLTNMSHELRTPLNAIIGYSEILMEDAADLAQENIVIDLEKIQIAGKHLLTLINDILDLSKIEAGKIELYLEDFKVPHIIDDVVATIHPLIEKNENQLEIDCAESVGLMHADLTKVRQILFNLLSNAAKFTTGGLIQLTVERKTDDYSQMAWIKFTISDNGIGMTPEQMAKLFQAFSQADASTTRKYGGTGLGLVISRHFCQVMGGDITVESEAQVGTKFIVQLPATVVRPASDTISAKAPPRKTERATQVINDLADSIATQVLVVDDNAATREMLGRTLHKEGWNVLEAGDGQSALQQLSQAQPALILLDLMMDEMDGFEFINEIQKNEQWQSIPVIVITAKDLTQQDRQQLSDSVVKILQKGAYNRQELLAQLAGLKPQP